MSEKKMLKKESNKVNQSERSKKKGRKKKTLNNEFTPQTLLSQSVKKIKELCRSVINFFWMGYDVKMVYNSNVLLTKCFFQSEIGMPNRTVWASSRYYGIFAVKIINSVELIPQIGGICPFQIKPKWDGPHKHNLYNIPKCECNILSPENQYTYTPAHSIRTVPSRKSRDCGYSTSLWYLLISLWAFKLSYDSINMICLEKELILVKTELIETEPCYESVNFCYPIVRCH